MCLTYYQHCLELQENWEHVRNIAFLYQFCIYILEYFHSFLGIIFHNLHLIIYGHQCRKFLFSNLLEDHPHNDYLSHSIFSTMICPCSDLLRFNPTLLLIYFICTFNIYYKVLSTDWSA